jgi:hypothetical protein
MFLESRARPVSQLSRKCRMLNISQSHRPPRSVAGIALLFYFLRTADSPQVRCTYGLNPIMDKIIVLTVTRKLKVSNEINSKDSCIVPVLERIKTVPMFN